MTDLEEAVGEEPVARYGVENLADSAATRLVAALAPQSLCLLAQRQRVDTKDVGNLVTLLGAQVGRDSDQVDGECKVPQLRGPPAAGRAVMLAVPRDTCCGVERRLEDSAGKPLSALGAGPDALAVHCLVGDGLPAVRREARRVEGEGLLVRVARRHDEPGAGSGFASPSVVPTDATRRFGPVLARTSIRQVWLYRTIGLWMVVCNDEDTGWQAGHEIG